MYGTTGSETRLDDLRTNNVGEHPGMSTVAQWLKSLRLHKYVWLFTNISYEQMMAIDEKYLEKLGVTKGARHKILVSIKKLHDRETVVAGAEADLASGAPGAAVRALERLRAVLLSPMPPGSPLPNAVVHALDVASKSITNSCTNGTRLPPPSIDEEHTPPVDPLSLHCWLVERALHHESFARADLQQALRRLRHRLPPRQFFHHVCDLPLARRNLKPKWRTGPPHGYTKPVKRVWAPPSKAPPTPRGKSNSYPPFPPSQHPLQTTNDEYSSLDALCLQMTEQAIN
ncbi:hypothetical protein O0L34_g13665 [Tuta absoluta]|nr:hypothetical protein O0L34_g13665 [Tuta absoluta]